MSRGDRRDRDVDGTDGAAGRAARAHARGGDSATAAAARDGAGPAAGGRARVTHALGLAGRGRIDRSGYRDDDVRLVAALRPLSGPGAVVIDELSDLAASRRAGRRADGG